jgi:hypothetical protein
MCIGLTFTFGSEPPGADTVTDLLLVPRVKSLVLFLRHAPRLLVVILLLVPAAAGIRCRAPLAVLCDRGKVDSGMGRGDGRRER